ncbi:MAG: hypothetical protein FWH04_10155 [Oscillospiraceae bacterium]|nr:hypothetical protein [Oscillospiraceae bacterium]
MNNLIRKSVAILLTLALVFGCNILPVQAAVVSSWAHIEFTQVRTFNVAGDAVDEVIGDGYLGIQNPLTTKYHIFDGSLRVVVKTGTTNGFQVRVDGNLIPSNAMTTNRVSGIDPVSKLTHYNYTITIANISQYISPNLTTHLFQVTTRNPSNINSTSANTLNIRKVVPSLPAAPTSVTYNNSNYRINGVNSTMEYRLYTTSWSNWASVPSGTTSIDLYPFLSTTRETSFEVRFRSPQSLSVGLTVPALEPAPGGSFAFWNDNRPAIAFMENGYYTISSDPAFSGDVGAYTNSSGAVGVYLDSFFPSLVPGSVIYVRIAADSTSSPSAYATIVIPPNAVVPNAGYDSLVHSITGLSSEMDIRVYKESWTAWLPINSSAVNVYTELSTQRETKVEVRYRDEPAAVQTIIIPPLEEAPEGLWADWVEGRPVIWGFETGFYYAVSSRADFLPFASIASATTFGVWVDTAFPNLAPGDSIYIRVAPNTSSASSAYATLIVPASITATANEGGTVSGGGNYAVNETVTLTATPDDDYTFDGWYEDGARISTSEAYSFTATVNRELEARFAEVVIVTEEPTP